MLSYKIINGKIIDGTGAPVFSADIGIKDDRIVEIGDLSNMEAESTVDAAGRFVCPGFIDIHTHSDMTVLYDGSSPNRVYDGVSSDVFGNCGVGVAPVSEEFHDVLMTYCRTRMVGNVDGEIAFNWRTYEEYLQYMNSCPNAINMIPLVAQGALRIFTMGLEQVPATAEQMETMKAELRKAMEAGAVGMSSGLIYLPGSFTPKEEMVELNKIVAEYDGIYTTHIRDEANDIENALEEAFDTARKAGVRLNISHLKAMGTKRNQMSWLFEKIANARKSGLTITADQYPYSTGMTSLLALIPPWASKDGIPALIESLKDEAIREKIIYDIENGIQGWQNFILTNGGLQYFIISTVMKEENKWMEGLRLTELAEKLNKTAYEVMFDLLIEEDARTLIIVEGMDENDIRLIASQPDVAVCSDTTTLTKSGLLGKGKPHPRGFGSHAKFLKKFVREEGMMSIEAAIRKMTSIIADRLHIAERGALKKGYFADVLIFDLDKVEDQATISEPRQFSKGFDTLFVNGVPVMEEGVQNDARPGRVLRRSY